MESREATMHLPTPIFRSLSPLRWLSTDRFGKPLRSVNCDCERAESPALPQALYIRNDEELLQMLDRADGWVSEVKGLKSPPKDLRPWIEQAYLRTVSRIPTVEELTRCQQHFANQESFADGLRDLLWALVNTQEFITNH